MAAVDDIVYVAAADGTVRGQNTGIVMKDGQKLLGAAAGLSVNGISILPRGAAPQLTNDSGAAIVTLANRNEIAGIDLNGQGHAAFGIVGMNVTEFNLHDNIIRQANSVAGIDFSGFGIMLQGRPSRIDDPPFVGTGSIANNTISGNSQGGVFLATFGSPSSFTPTSARADLVVDIHNNVILDNGGHGIETLSGPPWRSEAIPDSCT